MDELNKFRLFLIDLLTESRDNAKKANTETLHLVYDANIRLLERMIVFISKSIKEEVIDMEKAKSEIKVLDQGTIEELGRARRESPVTSKIIELAENLKVGSFARIDPKEIDPGHFTTRVHNLRVQKAIPENVKPKTMVNGVKGLFIVKLTKEQMALEPKRRSRKGD